MDDPTNGKSRDMATGSDDELVADYANNTAFEQTIWDLKMIFGEYSQRAGGVDWHTSITVPWAQAKLL